MTEIAETNKLWVFYDGNCRFCVETLQRVKPLLRRRGVQDAPLQAQWVRRRLDLPEERLLEEMKLLDAEGHVRGGADALIYLAKLYWWALPLYWLGQIPLVRTVLRRVYKRVAAKRYCINGTCALPNRSPKTNPVLLTLLITILPLLALPLAPRLPAWVFMWIAAGAMYAGFKALTWYALPSDRTKTFRRAIQYLLLWPGMDPKPFIGDLTANRPPRREWFYTWATILSGIALLYAVVPLFLRTHPVLAGWTAMVAIAFILHFGVFHLLALGWQTRRIAVEALMDKPALATSLSEFWGRRWNRAFNVLIYRFVFVPTFRKMNVAGATLLTFLVSGIIHEIVITIPARGGYGLPTLYFLAQGIGILIERTNVAHALGLGEGVRGWLLMALFTVGPAYWLFPPVFIHNIILPMLNVFGITAPLL